MVKTQKGTNMTMCRKTRQRRCKAEERREVAVVMAVNKTRALKKSSMAKMMKKTSRSKPSQILTTNSMIYAMRMNQVKSQLSRNSSSSYVANN
jgi:hypothetical protein